MRFKRFFIFTIKRFNASFKRILYEMINKFGEKEYKELSLLLLDEEFSSRLQSSTSAQNFHNLATRIFPLTANTVTQSILNLIVVAGIPQLKILGKDKRYIQATKI